MKTNNNFIPSINIQWLNKLANSIDKNKGTSPCIKKSVIMAIHFAFVRNGRNATIKLTSDIKDLFGLNRRTLKNTLLQLQQEGFIEVKCNQGQLYTIILKETPPAFRKK
jgi:hypothetical protein